MVLPWRSIDCISPNVAQNDKAYYNLNFVEGYGWTRVNADTSIATVNEWSDFKAV
jgi:hypothetical protein